MILSKANTRHHRGFTLIEVLVIVAIIGILSAIAWPTYQGYTIKQRRKAAVARVLEIMQEMQKCKTNNAAYTGAGCPASGDTFVDAANLYTLTLTVAVDGSSYSLEAARNDTGIDPDCTKLIIDNLGRKTATGNYASTPRKCWGD